MCVLKIYANYYVKRKVHVVHNPTRGRFILPKNILIILRATKTKIGRLWLIQRHAKRKISGTRGFGHM